VEPENGELSMAVPGFRWTPVRDIPAQQPPGGG